MTASRAHRGKPLEALLNFAHELYLNRQEDVRVEHNGTRGTFKSRGGKGVFVPDASKSAPDYYGCIDGQFIAFDAKTTQNKTRWSLHRKSAHQYQAMLDWSKAGAICWFAVEHRPDQVLYLARVDHRLQFEAFPDRLPWFSFPPPVDLRTLSCPLVDGWYDWLPMVRFGWVDD